MVTITRKTARALTASVEVHAAAIPGRIEHHRLMLRHGLTPRSVGVLHCRGKMHHRTKLLEAFHGRRDVGDEVCHHEMSVRGS